ncbi:MAG: leucine-rich repeat domain-containing protein, partial [Muribaculaceae bacterium]|nr:leucine-rich repeat domain-containing protein [Muribaculaceae bacterium]
MKNFTYSWMRGIATALCLMAVPIAFAANITVNGINYTTKAATSTAPATATVAKYTIIKATATTPADSLFYEGDIVIPQTITYEGAEFTVVATATNAFQNCRNLTSVVLPSTCVTIGRGCFSGCTSLTASPIPETVTSVGTSVFNGCSSLQEITIPAGWKKLVS